MTLRKRLSRYLSERISFHFYRGEGLTEAKLRIGINHYRLSRWKYKSGKPEWSYRSFRPDISPTLVSNESWLSLLARVDEAERAEPLTQIAKEAA